jgi:hypothetical protein
MNLKNRFAAIIVTAALAVPALAYAKYSEGKGSTVAVNANALAGSVNFTFKVDDNGISVADDGTNTTIEVDGSKFNDKESELRTKHAKKEVFKGGKDKFKVIVKNSDIEAAQKSKAKSLPATIKSGWGTTAVTITEFSRSEGKEFTAKGKIKTKLSALGVGKVCAVPVVGPCVKDEIEIVASIALKE